MDNVNDATAAAPNTTEASPLSWENLKTRVTAGVSLAIIVIALTVYHPLSFYAMVLFVALLMYAEWEHLTMQRPWWFRRAGLVYVALPIWSLIVLRGYALPTSHAELTDRQLGESPALVLYLFTLVWITDTCAFFGGKLLGRTKLAPAISPKKTWEGAGVGIVSTMVIGAFATLLPGIPYGFFGGMMIGLIISVAAQGGDLFQSWIKRQAGVKDSGNLIPGHGGMLDRVDGMVFAAPIFLFIYWLFG